MVMYLLFSFRSNSEKFVVLGGAQALGVVVSQTSILGLSIVLFHFFAFLPTYTSCMVLSALIVDSILSYVDLDIIIRYVVS